MRRSVISAALFLFSSLAATTPALAINATTYKGTIGRIPVIVEMMDGNATDQFFARYAYMSKGIDIPLHGRINDDGSLAIEEEAPCDATCRNASGELLDTAPIGADWSLTRLDREGKILEGSWKDRKTGKFLPVRLGEVGVRALPEGSETLDSLDPSSAVVGRYDVRLTPELLPYDFLKMDYPVKQGPETTVEGATIRMDSDPRTETSYPTIVTLPGADTAAINRYLAQQWLQYQFNPYYCLSTAYLGFGWSGGGGQGTTGLDGSTVTIEYLTPRLLGLLENSSSYCGGAYPNHIENRHFANVRTGEPVEAEQLLKGWVPKNADGEEIDPAKVVDTNNQAYGPSAALVAFVNARRDRSDAERETECGMNDLVGSNLGVYFANGDLVFNLKDLPHAIFACTDDLVRVPLTQARPLLNEQGIRLLLGG